MIRSPLIDYAEAFYEFGPEAAIPGPFKLDNSPYLAEPAFALCSPLIREVNCQFGAQGGKNALVEIFISYIVEKAPGNIVFYGLTDDDAERFAEKRVLKRIRPMACMQAVWPDTQAANRNREAQLAHMSIEFAGANPSNTQSRSCRYVIRDEAHRWDAGLMTQAADRCSAFWDAKILTTSTGPDENTDQDTSFKSGTQKIWNLGCPDCGKRVRGRFVQPKWTEKPRFLIWESNEVTRPEGKAWNIQEVRKTVRFKCPHEDCGAEYRSNYELRLEMNRNGSYVQTNEGAAANKESFRVGQLAYPWIEWEDFVETWIHAVERKRLGDDSLLKNFIVKQLAEPWKLEMQGSVPQIVPGGYSTKDVFRWVDESGANLERARYMPCDVQESGGRHFVYAIYAFAENSDSRLVMAGRAESWDSIEIIRKQFSVDAHRVVFDSNFAGKEVRENCARRGYTWLEAQEKTAQFPHTTVDGRLTVYRCYSKRIKVDPGIGTRQQGRKLAYGYRYSKEWAMQAVHYRVTGLGARFEVPADVMDLKWRGTRYETTSYMEQIGAWIPSPVPTDDKGKPLPRWKMIYKEDHQRSCFEMALVCAAIDRIVPSEVSEAEAAK